MIFLEEFERTRSESISGNKEYAVLHGTSGAHERFINGAAIQPGHPQIANHKVVSVSRYAGQPCLPV